MSPEEPHPSYYNYLSQGIFDIDNEDTQETSVREFTLNKTHTKKELTGKHYKLRNLRHEDMRPFRKHVVLGWKDNYYTNLLDWSTDNFMCGGFGTDLYLYNMAIDDDHEGTLHRNHSIPMNGEFVTSLKCSPMGSRVALGYSNGSMKLYDYVKEKSVYNGYHHLLRIAAVEWAGECIITGSKDQFLKIFDPRDKKPMPISHKMEHLHTQEICGVKQKGHFLCSGGNDNRVFIYDIRTQNTVGDYCHNAAVKAIAWVGAKTVVTGGGTADKKLKYWSSSKGVFKEIDTGSQICNLVWSEGTSELVSSQGFSLNQIILWSKKGERVFTFHGHSTRVLYSALSPSGEFLASGAGDQSLKIWKLFLNKSRESVLLRNVGLR